MMQKYQAIWREPAIQTNGFPKLMVHDSIQTGSINVKETRLPLWAIISTVINKGWEEAERSWSTDMLYGFSRKNLAHFLYCLLEQRGEFGRLLLVLANAEHKNDDGWWGKPKHRRAVMKQLQHCLNALKQIEDNDV